MRRAHSILSCCWPWLSVGISVLLQNSNPSWLMTHRRTAMAPARPPVWAASASQVMLPPVRTSMAWRSYCTWGWRRSLSSASCSYGSFCSSGIAWNSACMSRVKLPPPAVGASSCFCDTYSASAVRMDLANSGSSSTLRPALLLTARCGPSRSSMSRAARPDALLLRPHACPRCSVFMPGEPRMRQWSTANSSFSSGVNCLPGGSPLPWTRFHSSSRRHPSLRLAPRASLATSGLLSLRLPCVMSSATMGHSSCVSFGCLADASPMVPAAGAAFRFGAAPIAWCRRLSSTPVSVQLSTGKNTDTTAPLIALM